VNPRGPGAKRAGSTGGAYVQHRVFFRVGEGRLPAQTSPNRAENPTMNRYKILAEVEVIVLARLFGNGPWLIDPETGVALQRRLEQMGLEERVPGTTDMWRNTPLGSELHLDLLMVFMGLWDEWEIPMILEDHGLIDDLEAEHMLDLLGARGGNPGGSPYRARERLNADTIRRCTSPSTVAAAKLSTRS
jgi:hypothetical protein